MQGTGKTHSWRENMPTILMDLISKRPDRLLRLMEMGYSELRRAVEEKPKADMWRRLEARAAGLDNARLNLQDFIAQHAMKSPGEGEKLTDLRRLKSNLDGDMDRMRLVLQAAALMHPATAQAKAIEALVGVHISLKQLRKYAQELLQADRGEAEAPNEQGENSQETARAQRHRPQEGNI